MKKTVFDVPKMDCPSEERLIRMALESVTAIKKLVFDLSARRLTVIHEGDAQVVLNKLVPLNFGASLGSSNDLSEAEEAIGFALNVNDKEELSVLKKVFAINALMFFAEFIFGLLAQSTGLLADSLDMFADAAVFALSIFAVGKAKSHKKRAANISGILQLLLALGAFYEVVRKFLQGSEPEAPTMIIVAGIALIANAVCLWLLAKHRNGQVHMRASWIFLSNDVVANMGVIIAGILVKAVKSNIPDLVVGTVIAAVVARGALQIFRAAK